MEHGNPDKWTDFKPHLLVGNIRDIWWGQLEDGTQIEMEFIDYFKSVNYKKGKGTYIIFYAVATKEYTPLNIPKGAELIFFHPIQGYVNSLKQLEHQYKTEHSKDSSDGKNLLITIEKINDRSSKINYMKVKDSTEEQLLNAKKQYDYLKMEHEANKEKESFIIQDRKSWQGDYRR